MTRCPGEPLDSTQSNVGLKGLVFLSWRLMSRRNNQNWDMLQTFGHPNLPIHSQVFPWKSVPIKHTTFLDLGTDTSYSRQLLNATTPAETRWIPTRSCLNLLQFPNFYNTHNSLNSYYIKHNARWIMLGLIFTTKTVKCGSFLPYSLHTVIIYCSSK